MFFSAKETVPILVVFCLVLGNGAHGFRWITQKLVNDDMLVETSGLRYAISSELLKKHNWSCVSVDINSIHVFRPDCSSFTTKISDLSEEEKKLLAAARTDVISRQHITGADRYYKTGSAWRTVSAEYQYQGGQVVANRIHEKKLVDGFNVCTFGDDNLTIGGDQNHHLPNSFARVFFNYNLITTVDYNNDVRMIPMDCLKGKTTELYRAIFEKTQRAADRAPERG